MLKVNNRNTRTRCVICSKLIIKMPERHRVSFWYLYCQRWIYFTPCSSVSFVNFEQVNAGLSFEGNTIESITSQFELYQLINEPTRLFENSPLCIDLIFTLQWNVVVESRVHVSLHHNFHHQTVFAKFSLMISYPPTYPREVRHYREANTDLFRTVISNFNWKGAFHNTNVTKKVFIFNKTILKVFYIYVPHKTLTL